MSKNYYYADSDDQVHGPFSLPELETMHKAGQIAYITRVCEEGTEKWMQFHKLARPSPQTPKPNKKRMRRVGMQSQTKHKPSHDSGELNWFGPTFWVVICSLVFGLNYCGSEDEPSRSSSSTPAPKYCVAAGCTNRPSTWYGGESGYCKQHAQRIMEQQKLIDKVKNQ